MNLLVSLKYLVALDEHRHFGRAALACHVTQPALSNALRALEDNFDTSIVKRGRNFEGFTPEGERVLQSARRILREEELLQQDLRSGVDSPAGNLWIGAVPTAMPIAARFVGLLQDTHPGIRPSLRSMSSVELETGLAQLSLDMGLGYSERNETPARNDDHRALLQSLPQYVEHYFLLRKKLPAAGASTVARMTWAQAASLPLCLLSAEMHNRTIIDRAFAATGAHVQPAIETNSTVTLMLTVMVGHVATVLPGALLGAMQHYPELEALPLFDPQVEVPMALMVHATHRPSRTAAAALAFAQSDAWLAHAKRHSGLSAG
jgi:DNA-binding transcriptional LysR family regulator